MKYRKKPVVIEAVQWTGHNVEEATRFCTGKNVSPGNDGALLIHTLEGTMRADPSDWIIKGVLGEVYPCKPEIFEATYTREEAEPA